MQIGVKENYSFTNPEEELQHLREKVANMEKAINQGKIENPREGIIPTVIQEHKKVAPDIGAPHYFTEKKENEGIILRLAPEPHDRQMEELLHIIQNKGVYNAISIVEKLNSPHILDDFERFLVQYIKSGQQIKGLPERSPFWKGLHMSLYEVALPEMAEEERNKGLKELVSKMEQFYSGMLSISNSSKDRNYFTLEIANPNGTEEFVFYVAVPDDKRALFEKQAISIFPEAKIIEQPNDYNIFGENSVPLASIASFGRPAGLCLKTYDRFDYDPINVLLNAFSKIKMEGEGAAVQINISPAGDKYLRNYKKAIEEIRKGKTAKKALEPNDGFAKQFFKALGELFESNNKKEKEQTKIVDEMAIKSIEEKITTPISLINIRLIVSSESESRSSEILSHIESSFNQFEDTNGNKIKFERIKKGSKLREFIKGFSYRIFDNKFALPLSIKELTTMAHFPSVGSKNAPQLKQAKSGSAPAPMELPKNGVLLGVNRYRGVETKVMMTKEDRLRHFYVIGQTGTGKTTILKNMIVQDIINGEGVCMIDPHGSDIVDILSSIPPSRYDDVIYFDPAYMERPMGLNMMEYDPRFPEQKTFVVNELFSIFRKLYSDVPESMGPMFEQYFRNSAMLVMDHPESGNTLLEISRVLSDKAYRNLKLMYCKNPLVAQFWQNAEKTTGEQSLANFVPYITNKFDVFLQNDIMRPVVAQEKSSFNFRDIMDNRKILLVNLSKGKLGDINSNLIGLIIIGKILMAALSRVDSLGKDLPPFYLYVDEFQNVTTDSISTILSEARKYKLSLNIAHQFIAQLEEGIKDSVFGNVGSMAVFRVGAEDAEYLEKQMSPVFTAKDMMNLDNYNAYLKMLSKGVPTKPFNIITLPPPPGNPTIVEKLKELSYMKYGRPRADVEGEIMKKYIRN